MIDLRVQEIQRLREGAAQCGDDANVLRLFDEKNSQITQVCTCVCAHACLRWGTSAFEDDVAVAAVHAECTDKTFAGLL